MDHFKITFSAFIFLSLTSPSFALRCPSPDQFTYTQQSDGSYLLNPPNGYTAEPIVADPNIPFTFYSAYMFGKVDPQKHEIKNLSYDLRCTYRNIHGAYIKVWLNNSKQKSFSYSADWSWRGYNMVRCFKNLKAEESSMCNFFLIQ